MEALELRNLTEEPCEPATALPSSLRQLAFFNLLYILLTFALFLNFETIYIFSLEC